MTQPRNSLACASGLDGTGLDGTGLDGHGSGGVIQWSQLNGLRCFQRVDIELGDACLRGDLIERLHLSL